MWWKCLKTFSYEHIQTAAAATDTWNHIVLGFDRNFPFTSGWELFLRVSFLCLLPFFYFHTQKKKFLTLRCRLTKWTNGCVKRIRKDLRWWRSRINQRKRKELIRTERDPKGKIWYEIVNQLLFPIVCNWYHLTWKWNDVDSFSIKKVSFLRKICF